MKNTEKMAAAFLAVELGDTVKRAFDFEDGTVKTAIQTGLLGHLTSPGFSMARAAELKGLYKALGRKPHSVFIDHPVASGVLPLSSFLQQHAVNKAIAMLKAEDRGMARRMRAGSASRAAGQDARDERARKIVAALRGQESGGKAPEEQEDR
jgi:hypothetical protein